MKKGLLILLCLPMIGFGQFTDNFSDGDFTNNPNWIGDVGNFEVDTNNALHLNDNVANTSYLSTPSQAIINGSWEFSVRLDFSPSTSNYAKVYIASDMMDLSGPLNGVYVQIGGQSGNIDDISLYTQNGTNRNEIIDGVAGLVSNDPDIRVKVTRDAIGNWELFLDTNGIFFTQGTAFDNSITSSDYFGVYCKYTVTRAKKMWFDDFSVSGGMQQTYVPDDNFEQRLINLGYDNFLDDSVITANIDTVTSLSVYYLNIADLTGIEDFSALTTLYCPANQLTSLDVSQNTALNSLNCTDNQLTSLDVSTNTALTTLSCRANQLTSLDVSNNTALTNLDCALNYPSLTSLDVSGATSLTTLDCYFNQITSLDVSTNIALITLYCDSNQLTILDVSQNTALTSLQCFNNQLTSLDVSNNIALTDLACYSNHLTSLDIRNGNNINFTDFWATNNSNLSCINVDDPVYSTANWTVANGNIDPQHYFNANCATAFGCTDSLACNYDASANTDDGSCAYASTSTDTQVHCNAYTWLDGITYTSSNNSATFTSTNAAGCDNVATLNLTINNSTTSTDTQVACDAYTWLNGVTYTASNSTATFTSTNAAGCDNVATLDLTINNSTSSFDTLSVTASIVWNGTSLNVSGDYSVTLINSAGCDSIANLNLTVSAPTWDCVNNACIDPGTGNGQYSTQATCTAVCGVSAIQEHSTNKELLKATDLLGRETKGTKNEVLFYIYDDGTVEKRIVIE